MNWRNASITLVQFWPKTPRGWTLMAYEKRGKMVCRYFAGETT